jgi:hypothetical protein
MMRSPSRGQHCLIRATQARNTSPYFTAVRKLFRRCGARYPSSYSTKTFSYLDRFLYMAFAQLTFRESLRDIEVCLRAQGTKLYHLGGA